MKKLLLVMAVMLFVASLAFAQITGQGYTYANGGINNTPASDGSTTNLGNPGLGRHNLLNSSGASMGCESCHIPHTAPTYGSSFLWAWKTVPTNVTTYVSDTNPSGALVTPAGRTANTRSVLCLTCHDGTSANANGITANLVRTNMMPFSLLNTTNGSGSLSSQHPVDALVPNNGDYVQPVAVTGSLSASADSVTANIGVDGLPLWAGDYRVECESCHDQHNDFTTNNGNQGGIPFLRVASNGNQGTQLCRECHNQ